MCLSSSGSISAAVSVASLHFGSNDVLGLWESGDELEEGGSNALAECEGNTTTMPLLLSEILWRDELMGSEHTSTLVQ